MSTWIKVAPAFYRSESGAVVRFIELGKWRKRGWYTWPAGTDDLDYKVFGTFREAAAYALNEEEKEAEK